MSSVGDTLAPLLLASVLGAVVGFERELHGRPAGLRTHILLSLGAALFGMVSQGMGATGGDPGRIAAQVVTGIGFIGAGTILHLGGTVRGLTTAASIWTTAAVGLAVGLDRRYWLVAVVATVLAFLTLRLLHLLDDWLRFRRRTQEVEVLLRESPTALGAVIEALAGLHAELQAVRALPTSAPGTRRYTFSLDLPSHLPITRVVETLARCEQVEEVQQV
ncbi:MAG: MgtC/SapB family protein [Armatimonadota bacterium]|nr:MgtC/SapB family protein [Armatimonadota bacterium]MDW8103443.1 MgtC/SapB family protein [Armatimonadota bacterium]MDW8289577.1 MgtC/SapB family protein [Armatimonadota bacterium]